MISNESRLKHLGTPEDCGYEEKMTVERASWFAKQIPEAYKNKTIADMGGSYGIAAKYLIENYGAEKVIVVDINQDIIPKRKQHPNIEYKQELIHSTTIQSNSLDVINAVEVIEHVDEEEVDLAIKHWHDLLKTNGYLYTTTPLRRWPKNEYPKGSHFTEYDFEEIKNIIENKGFKLIWYLEPKQADGISMALLFEKVTQ